MSVHDMDQIENVKENIVPLKQGRSFATLVKTAALQENLSARDQLIHDQEE